MSQVFVAERSGKPKGDPLLASVVVLMMGMGLVLLFSASWYRSSVLYETPYQFITNQAIYAIAGLLVALLVSKIKINHIRKLIPWMVVGTFILMVLTLITGIGANFLGGQRWLVIANISLQPSEMVKISLILYLASILAKKENELGTSLRGILAPFGVMSLFVFMIYWQNNFSTALFVFIVSVAMLFMAGVKARFFLLLLLIGAPLVVLGVMSKDYRVERWNIFMAPERDPSGSGYQTLSAQAAIKSGAVWGKGIGLGTRKLGQLPEAQSDYIFAVIAEELGFIGVLGILALFGFFAWRGYLCALRAKDGFDRLLAFGITTAILLQALLNVAVTIGVVPPTGINLPFFSSGGTSLLITLVMVGLLYNISRRSSQNAEAGNA